MNAQLKGIAVILFGILLTILGSSIVLSVVEVSLVGAVVGLIGVIVVFVTATRRKHRNKENLGTYVPRLLCQLE